MHFNKIYENQILLLQYLKIHTIKIDNAVMGEKSNSLKIDDGIFHQIEFVLSSFDFQECICAYPNIVHILKFFKTRKTK